MTSKIMRSLPLNGPMSSWSKKNIKLALQNYKYFKLKTSFGFINITNDCSWIDLIINGKCIILPDIICMNHKAKIICEKMYIIFKYKKKNKTWWDLTDEEKNNIEETYDIKKHMIRSREKLITAPELNNQNKINNKKYVIPLLNL